MGAACGNWHGHPKKPPHLHPHPFVCNQERHTLEIVGSSLKHTMAARLRYSRTQTRMHMLSEACQHELTSPQPSRPLQRYPTYAMLLNKRSREINTWLPRVCRTRARFGRIGRYVGRTRAPFQAIPGKFGPKSDGFDPNLANLVATSLPTSTAFSISAKFSRFQPVTVLEMMHRVRRV